MRNFTKGAYEAYFGLKLGDQDKSLAPHKVCKQRSETLRFLTQGKATSMRFLVPMVWGKPITIMKTLFLQGGYYRMESAKEDWYYPDVESARRPIPHCPEVPLPVFISLPHLTADATLLEVMEDTDSSCSNYSSTSVAPEASSLSTKPKPFSQGQLNDLVRDLNLSRESSEILASRLGEHGILVPETKITFYRNRDDLLIRFFTMEAEFVHCNNIPGLPKEMRLS